MCILKINSYKFETDIFRLKCMAQFNTTNTILLTIIRKTRTANYFSYTIYKVTESSSLKLFSTSHDYIGVDVLYVRHLLKLRSD